MVCSETKNRLESSAILNFGMIRTFMGFGFINHINPRNAMELYLSKQEWVILRYAAIGWTCFQSWDLCWELYDRYSKRTSSEAS